MLLPSIPTVVRSSLVAFLLFSASITRGGDWPQWRYDSGRGASTPDELPGELHLQWLRQLPAPRPAWPASQPALRFDASYSPVAAGKRLFVPSTVDDSVTAYDSDTGQMCWRFYADGPVRLSPIAAEGRVWFGSDDGYLYCLNADDGKLRWRVLGGPAERHVLGNGRLIGTWPIRTGPVLLGRTIYFTAGIWPFMGIFVHAVDATSGRTRWVNSGEGATYAVQPHNSPAFSGFVPRGHMAATAFGLIAPGGRTQPGVYDLETGRLRHFRFGDKGGGTYEVAAHGPWYVAGGTLQRVEDGRIAAKATCTVHDEQAFYELAEEKLSAWSWEVKQEAVVQEKSATAATASAKKKTLPRLKPIWTRSLPEAPGRLYLKAGSRFYAGKRGSVSAVELAGDPARIAWTGKIEGQPWAILAADQKLFVVTLEGAVYCFGGQRVEPRSFQPTNDALVVRAPAGNCLVFGSGSADIVKRLADEPGLHVIAIAADPATVDAVRKFGETAGCYGTRVVAHLGDPANYPLPPYMADRIVVADARETMGAQRLSLAKAVLHALRPYGGVAYWPIGADALQDVVAAAKLTGVEVLPDQGYASRLVRIGPPPGAADWTHQYADAGNSVCSADQLVRAPLGLLWFGGPPNDEVLPRHGHGPSPQVAAGRLVIEGMDMLRAVDIYTGRLLWQKKLPDLGKFYNNILHQPGANEIGSNYVTMPDAVYVAHRDGVLVLDAATGRELRRITCDLPKGATWPAFGSLSVAQDYLVATRDAVPLAQSRSVKERLLSWPPKSSSGYGYASRRLMVFQRHTGQALWQRQAAYSFRHNNIALGSGKLFCVDNLSETERPKLAEKGQKVKDYSPRLLALDLATGKEIWSTGQDVFGTMLSYSAEHDVLLQTGSAGRDRAPDEVQRGMVAYGGRDGKVLWKDIERKVSGPCMLHHDVIITQGPAYSLLTGEPKRREHPLTGQSLPWGFTRNYGCNTATASEHLLLFRSAAAGFYDLQRDGGTGNLGGFRSSCTSNMIAAGGLLNAPEYTRTCTCPYQNQTSLALVHDPDAETWSFNALKWDGAPVRRVGLNFAAPGDRRADDGTLWLDWPSRGGTSPDLPVTVEPPDVETFCHHATQLEVPLGSVGLPWVAASGLEGVRRVTIALAKLPSLDRRPYTVRLHFAEPDSLSPGDRVFDVRLQGEKVLAGFDVFREAGASRTAVVKEFRGVKASQTLEIAFEPVGRSTAAPILCGLEAVAEGW